MTPNGWIIVCAPPPIITSASPRRRISVASPIACVMAAQAVRQFSAGPRAPVSSARCDSGMFGSCSSSRMTFISSRRDLGPLHRVDRASPRLPRRQGGGGVRVEVERAFAGAEVDADAIEIELVPRRAPPIFHACAHAASANCVLRPAPSCCAIVGDVLGEVESPSPRPRCWSGKVDASKMRGLRDAGLAGEQALPDRLDGMAHRRDPAHSGDDDSVHGFVVLADAACLASDLRRRKRHSDLLEHQRRVLSAEAVDAADGRRSLRVARLAAATFSFWSVDRPSSC